MPSLKRKRPVLVKRKVNFSVPTNTDHREYTVTNNCYLISAGKPCFGCTQVNVQEPEAGLIYDKVLKMNVDFIKTVAQKQVDDGINLLTYMGGEPLTIQGFEEVIRWTTDHPVLNCLVYSSCSYFFDSEGRLSKKFDDYEKAGLFDQNYFLASVDHLVLSKRKINSKNGSSAFKSYWGLKMTAELSEKGYHEVAIHQTLRNDNLDEVLKLYQWAKDHGVKFSLCPLIYKPYISRGKDLSFYDSRLRKEHKPKLREIISYLIKEETYRLNNKKERQIIPSSAFLRLIPEFGLDNVLNCITHRKGKKPNTQDVHPSGEGRWCIAQNTKNDGKTCLGCHYIGIDRGRSDYWNFEHLAGSLKSGDLRWLNYHVWKKDPRFDRSRRNIAFRVMDEKGNLKPLSEIIHFA